MTWKKQRFFIRVTQRPDLFIDHYSLVICRLVMVDVAFYSENVQGLRSLERLDLNMPEIWEQKRWWRTARLGQSGLFVTPTITATCSAPQSEQEVRSVDCRCVLCLTPVLQQLLALLPQRRAHFQGLEVTHFCITRTNDGFLEETKSGHTCVVDQSQLGIMGNVFFCCCVKRDASSVPPSVPPLQCNFPYVCNSVPLSLLLLLNYLIAVRGINEWLFILIDFVVDLSIMSRKAFRR